MDYGVSGVQVHDPHLVAVMRIHEVKRILTFNTKDFARFDGIEALHPAAVTHASDPLSLSCRDSPRENAIFAFASNPLAS